MSVPASTTDDPDPVVPPTRLRGRPGVLRRRDFALLFAGQATSTLGDRVVLVAVPFAVLSLPGAGAGDVGLVLGASALSLAVFVLIGGVVADRLPRHRTMLASDIVRALVQAATAALLLTGHATVAVLMALQAGYGAAEAFFRPALLGLVPQVVAPGEEQEANALLSLPANIGLVLGPAIAGVLVAALGPGSAVAIDAGTFAVSALTLALLRAQPGAPRDRHPFFTELAAGWREVTGRDWVRGTLLAFAAYHALVLPALFVLGPQVALHIRGGAAAWGIITAGFGVGTVVGSVIALRWRPHRPGAVLGACLCAASTQAAICVSSLPTALVAGLEFVTGIGVALAFTLWETALQQHIPPAAQSRVSSFDYFASLTLMPFGYLIVGPIAGRLGPLPTAVGASALTLVACAAITATAGLRSLRAPDPSISGPRQP
jgi:MFS family permease